MDILETEKRLKKMPYEVPAGYFDRLEERVMSAAEDSAHTASRVRRPVYFRIVQTAAAAAMAAAAVLGSITLAENIVDARIEEQMAADSFFYTELVPSVGTEGIMYEPDESGYIADMSLSDEDIIDYLIYSGTPVELLNESDYE